MGVVLKFERRNDKAKSKKRAYIIAGLVIVYMIVMYSMVYEMMRIL